jgi:hypothetical protein
MNNKYTLIAVALLLVGTAFYGGIKYNQINNKASLAGARARFGQNAGQGFTGTGKAGAMGARGGGVAGEVLSKDATSITVKLRDGGSKIVFYSGSTQVTKSAAGTIDDVAIGGQVVVTSTPNSDGSVTAQSIQLR